MSLADHTKYLATAATITVIAISAGWEGYAQAQQQAREETKCDECGPPTNDAPNPYTTVTGFFKLPDGRTWGSTSMVDMDRDGKTVWAVDRCGANSCISDPATGAINPEDIIFHFDEHGNVIAHFGGGMFATPHGIYVDKDNNVWVTDYADNAPRAGGAGAAGGSGRGGRGGARGGAAAAQGGGGAPAGRGAAAAAAATPPGPGAGATKGHQVFKFSHDGKLLMTIGVPGGSLTQCCFQPNDVLVTPDGSIFITQGHNDTPGSVQVVWKFDKDGHMIKPIGAFGHGRGEWDQPHSLAMDSAGRIYVADRNNNRIQIMDQNGYILDIWYQFSRPSGLFIDKNDILYSADSESQGVSRNHAGWRNGIRIGSVKDGKVRYFIPDPARNPTGTSAAEGVAADDNGNVYGAEVGPRDVKKYVKK